MENGGEKEVTEENKSQYLNALAQYRLTKRVSEEISQFLKGGCGLYAYIPGADPGFQERGGPNKGEGLHYEAMQYLLYLNTGWKDK